MMSNADSVKDGYSCNNLTTSNHGSDYMIGFNDIRFSDGELIIEIFAGDGGESSCSEVCSRSTKLHVISLLLAAKSPFFHNLFRNGMMESEQRCVTLRIHASEEAAVMELLKYMYSGTLTSTTSRALLDVLKLADKFQVIPCMRLCTSLLTKLPMSTETALLYLTCSLQMADEVQPLVDAAKQFLADRYKYIHGGNVWKEIMEMPLVGIEVIFSSDALEICSEDDLFDLALEWTKANYPKLGDQRKILSAHLGRFIRFPHMSLEKLRELSSCDILDDDFVSKVMVDALFFKTMSPHDHHGTMEDSNYRRRDYIYRPVKAVEFEFPCQEVVVYFDLTWDACAGLYASEPILTEVFHFGARPFHLFVHAFFDGNEERISEGEASTCFNVCLQRWRYDMQEPLALDYEVSVRSECTKDFVSKKRGSLEFTFHDDLTLYETPWLDFKAGKSLDFIDGILYFEVRLRRKKSRRAMK